MARLVEVKDLTSATDAIAGVAGPQLIDDIVIDDEDGPYYVGIFTTGGQVSVNFKTLEEAEEAYATIVDAMEKADV